MTRNKREGQYAGCILGKHVRHHKAYHLEILSRAKDIPDDTWTCFHAGMSDEEIYEMVCKARKG